jgi:hypothetical protein
MQSPALPVLLKLRVDHLGTTDKDDAYVKVTSGLDGTFDLA